MLYILHDVGLTIKKIVKNIQGHRKPRGSIENYTILKWSIVVTIYLQRIDSFGRTYLYSENSLDTTKNILYLDVSTSTTSLH